MGGASGAVGPGVDVVLVDRNNYTLLPLLYQVAAAEIEPEQIAYPLQCGVFRGQQRVSVALADRRQGDAARRVLHTLTGQTSL